METATRVKRPRGRPRRDAPPRPKIHVEIDSAVKVHLETAAQAADRSLAKEVNIRLTDSAIRDEVYGGPEMAALFRELAEVAIGIARQNNRGSFFEDFETFVRIRQIWQAIIQRHMPRPDEQLIATIQRDWETNKSEPPRTSINEAVLEWLQHRALLRGELSLVQLLAGVPNRIENPQPADDQPSGTSQAVATDHVAPPAFGSLAKVLEGLSPPKSGTSSTLTGSEAASLGSMAKIMEGFVQAAGQVSRLAQLLANPTEETAATTDTPSPPESSRTNAAGVPE
jgi:hypothetical protein